MKIIKTKDQSIIIYINNKIKEYIEREEIKEYNHQLFVKWLRTALLNPLVAVWLCIEEDKALGYIIVQILQTLTEEKVTICQLFGDTPEIESQLLDTAEKWAKKNGITIAQVSTFHPKKWKAKGFEVKEHLLMKEI